MALHWHDVRLSVLMPAWNERARIERAVRRVREVPLDIELICIDDGSTDGTARVLAELEERGEIDVVATHERNRGKGAALRTGIERVSGNVTVVQDADLEYDPHELPRLLEPILAGNADAVIGSRFQGGPHRVLYFWHRVGNGLLTLLSNMLTDLNLTDMEVCYKMVRTDLLETLPLRSNRFGVEPELVARLAQAGARVYEVPVTYHGRTYAEGKKIDWRDGAAALWHLLRCNLLGPRAPVFAGGELAAEGDARASGANVRDDVGAPLVGARAQPGRKARAGTRPAPTNTSGVRNTAAPEAP